MGTPKYEQEYFTKFEQKTIKKVVSYIAAGNTMKTAAAASGIGYSTLKRWMDTGKSKTAPQAYQDFRASVKKARAEAEVRAVSNIVAAGLDPRHWQANAWYLERCVQGRYLPPKTRVETKSLDAPSPADALREAEQRAAQYTPPPETGPGPAEDAS